MSNVLAPIEEAARTIASFHRQLAQDSRSLLGYVMTLGYDEGVIVTNDYYKMRAGGVAKNSFLLIRPGSVVDLIHPRDRSTVERDFQDQPSHLVLARVLEPAATPLSQDISRTYFEMHKSHMPALDVFTKSELQWGAMKIAILGTFFDDPSDHALRFGGDIQTFLSPHMYTVHVPTAPMLEILVNAFVDQNAAQEIGRIRLTETLLENGSVTVPVCVSPRDFIGSRTALFGKTRMGKSNTVKIIAQMILDSNRDVGQVIFDLNGEYANRNEQDDTSLYELYQDRCIRYTLRANPQPGVRVLKADFFRDVALGHQIISTLYRSEVGKPQAYENGFFEWEYLPEEEVRELEQNDRSAAVRYRRQLSIYQAILHEAGYEHDPAHEVTLHLNQPIRARLATELPSLGRNEGGTVRVPDQLRLADAAAAYRAVWRIYDPADPVFRTSSGRDYFDDTAQSMLSILSRSGAGGSPTYAGFRKIVPYRQYHSRQGGDLLREIVRSVDQNMTVIIDLSNAPEELVTFFGELVSQEIFHHQMTRFTEDRLGQHYVQFYFEEAHNLFPRDDKNLRGIYNRLAKEGAKLHIGIIYSTQSIESLSPDLLKNTENFFIAHLNDDREIKALTRFHEFRDVGADVQRTKTQGFVRMITRSHKFALPVQIRRFEARG